MISDFLGARRNVASSYTKNPNTPPLLFCESFIRKGEVLGYIGELYWRTQNLKDKKDKNDSGSFVRGARDRMVTKLLAAET